MTELPRHVLEQRLSWPHDRGRWPGFGKRSLALAGATRLECLFVPGRTAQKRISRWLAEHGSGSHAFADEKGRDAFVFNPFESRYLKFSSQHCIVPKSVFSRLRSLKRGITLIGAGLRRPRVRCADASVRFSAAEPIACRWNPQS